MTRAERRAAAPALELAFAVPERGLDIAFTVPAGSTTALIGGNGAGKSSTFAVLSGLLRPARSRVVLGGTTLSESAARRWRAPHARGVVQLMQHPLLFPTMSVADNAAFGLQAAGTQAAASRAAARDMLARVGAGELAERRPDRLSGGQAQRVAIARALVTDPALLLLDEPFAQLDGRSAAEISGLCAQLLIGRTALLITHDPAEAHALTDRAVVLDAGRVVQTGTWEDIARDPATPVAHRFVAGR